MLKFLFGISVNYDKMLGILPSQAVKLQQQLQSLSQGSETCCMLAPGWPSSSSVCSSLEALPAAVTVSELQGVSASEAGDLYCCWRVTAVLFSARIGRTVLNFQAEMSLPQRSPAASGSGRSQVVAHQCQEGSVFLVQVLGSSGGPQALEWFVASGTGFRA